MNAVRGGGDAASRKFDDETRTSTIEAEKLRAIESAAHSSMERMEQVLLLRPYASLRSLFLLVLFNVSAPGACLL